jgi:hypothetical protein
MQFKESNIFDLQNDDDNDIIRRKIHKTVTEPSLLSNFCKENLVTTTIYTCTRYFFGIMFKLIGC